MPTRHTPNMPWTWTGEEIATDTRDARAEFRVRRLDEPLALYTAHFPTAKAAADVVVNALSTILAVPANCDLVAGIVGNKQQFSALRSLAAVPISEDDLDTLLDTSLSKTALRRDQALADQLAELLKSSLDPQRFPWVAQNRPPTRSEQTAAKLATAVLTSVSAVQAMRRGEESQALEGKVCEILDTAGYKQVPKQNGGIKQIAHFPEPGTYMRQCVLGGHNADFVIRLLDGRLFPMECKASNSEVNGFKRLNKEVVVDAGDWYREFGQSSVVAAAALRGVFKTDNVAAAQAQRVHIFWWHKMDMLARFLAGAQAA